MEQRTNKVSTGLHYEICPYFQVDLTCHLLVLFGSYISVAFCCICSTNVSLQCCNVEGRQIQMKTGTVYQTLHRNNTIEIN